MDILLRIVIGALVVILCAYLLPGVHVDGFVTAIVVALVLALLNAIVKPILVFITIPITIITLGLFLLVINALIILLAAWLVPGFNVDGFLWALLFSLILSLIMSLVR